VPRYVALLRAISNASMAPFRARLESLGFEDVESYGMSGNLFFSTDSSDREDLEQRITAEFGTPASVFTRLEIAKAARHPYREHDGAAVMFLTRTPSRSARAALTALVLDPPVPQIHGRITQLVFPARRRGRRTPVDFEEVLGVSGTMRSLRVVEALLKRFG
jgi:uncharacterized protein (DUF1697 family)